MSTMIEPTLSAGQVLVGRYRIDTVLARGGFSFVYLAQRVDDGDVVVVKVLHHEAMRKDPNAGERFKREAGIAMELQHRHHVRVYDYGSTPDGLPFLVLERLHGCELQELFEKQAPLRDTEVRDILRQILLGLAEMHDHGVAHRDLKPPNVFVCDGDDGARHVKLIDYGLAKVLSSEHPLDKANLTTKDIVVGTPGYLAPELLMGEDTTVFVDQYAAGIIAWELLTGRRAYDGTMMERAVAQSRDNPPSPGELVEHSPLWPIVERLLERDPTRRFPSAQAAADALDELELTDPVPLKPPPGPGIALIVGAAVVVAIAIALLVLFA